MHQPSRGFTQWMRLVFLALGLGGCASLPGILHDTSDLTTRSSESPSPLETPVAAESQLDGAMYDTVPVAAVIESPDAHPEAGPAADADAIAVAQRTTPSPPLSADDQMEEYDPWEPFNEAMFEFNRGLDRWIIKPAAKAYNHVVPDLLQEMIGNGLDNIRFVPRMVNSLLQGKLAGAGREVARFLINSSVGFGGLFDPAKKEFGIQKSKEDAGQTLGAWGAGPGPYLVLPFLPPLTVRDGIGFAADMAMDPLGYFLPFIWGGAAMKAGDTINDRSLNLELYQGFEETTVEFYSALRNAYLQRRQKLIRE